MSALVTPSITPALQPLQRKRKIRQVQQNLTAAFANGASQQQQQQSKPAPSQPRKRRAVAETVTKPNGTSNSLPATNSHVDSQGSSCSSSPPPSDSDTFSDLLNVLAPLTPLKLSATAADDVQLLDGRFCSAARLEANADIAYAHLQGEWSNDTKQQTCFQHLLAQAGAAYNKAIAHELHIQPLLDQHEQHTKQRLAREREEAELELLLQAEAQKAEEQAKRERMEANRLAAEQRRRERDVERQKAPAAEKQRAEEQRAKAAREQQQRLADQQRLAEEQRLAQEQHRRSVELEQRRKQAMLQAAEASKRSEHKQLSGATHHSPGNQQHVQPQQYHHLYQPQHSPHSTPLSNGHGQMSPPAHPVARQPTFMQVSPTAVANPSHTGPRQSPVRSPQHVDSHAPAKPMPMHLAPTVSIIDDEDERQDALRRAEQQKRRAEALKRRRSTPAPQGFQLPVPQQLYTSYAKIAPTKPATSVDAIDLTDEGENAPVSSNRHSTYPVIQTPVNTLPSLTQMRSTAVAQSPITARQAFAQQQQNVNHRR